MLFRVSYVPIENAATAVPNLKCSLDKGFEASVFGDCPNMDSCCAE